RGRRARRSARVRQRDQRRGGAHQEDRLAGGRRSRHPRGARPRGGQHPRHGPHVSVARRRRRHRARCARAEHPDESCRQRAHAAGVVRGGGARRPRAALARGGRRMRRPASRGMNALLVVNAGSSSLKFCVYSLDDGPQPTLVCRGQLDGIGKRPRLYARDGAAVTLTDQAFDPGEVPEVGAAMDRVGAWLRQKYVRTNLVAVGHRVAHGGPQYAAPVGVCHLGRGSSRCAIKNGRSVASTMGFTALDGLPMGTRCGQLDPGVVLYLLMQKGYSPKDVEQLLYQQAGLRGLSSMSNDVRDLLESDDPRARLALDYLVYRVAREIGSLAMAMDGID